MDRKLRIIKPILSHLKGLAKVSKDSGPTPSADNLMGYILGLITNRSEISDEVIELIRAGKLDRKDRIKAYLSIYLELEEFILKNKPPVVKDVYTSKSLREDVKNNVDIKKLDLPLKFLFVAEKEREAYVYLLGISRLMEYINENSGFKHLAIITKQLTAGTILEQAGITPDGLDLEKIDITDGNLFSLLKKFYHALYDEILKSQGERATLDLINDIYRDLKVNYESDVAVKFLEFQPLGVMNSERLKLLSREEMEKEIQERTIFLEETKQQLEEKLNIIADQNRKLEETKKALLNVLEDAKHLEETLKQEKANVERKVIESTRELNEEQGRLQASINSLNIGLIMVDTDCNVLALNIAAKKILDPDKFIDLSGALAQIPGSIRMKLNIEFIEHYFEGSLDLKSHIRQCLDEKKTVEVRDFNYRNRFLDILIHPILALIDYKNIHGEVVGAVVMLEDKTEEKLLNRSRDEFFSIASHELRTPLTAIRGNTALIKEQYAVKFKDEKDFWEMVEDIHDASIHLIDIVNDFLDVSRIEQGKITLRMESFRPEEVIRKVLEDMRSTAEEKHLYLRFDADDAVLTEVNADKERVSQVIYNLIGNGLKFTEKGGVSVMLTKMADKVEVKITDTGRGISAINQNLLFRKFQQAGDSIYTRDTTKGTGLGLYISRLLIERMGGELHLEGSEENKGSVFVFTLPVSSSILQK